MWASRFSEILCYCVILYDVINLIRALRGSPRKILNITTN